MAFAPLIFGAATSLASMAASQSQASLERGEAEIAAKGEELRLEQREADRKDRLASALASQNAMAGAKGVAAFEGSPLTILQDSIEREQLATERDAFSTSISNMALRSRARSRQRMQRFRTGAQLYQTAQPLIASGGLGG